MKVVGLAPKLKKNCASIRHWLATGRILTLWWGCRLGTSFPHLEECEADKLASRANAMVASGKNGKQQRRNQKALNLYPSPTDLLNSVYCDKISCYNLSLCQYFLS